MVYDDFFATIKRRIVCFGAGQRGAALLHTETASAFLDQIVFFVDNDDEKQGTTISCAERDFFVFPPEKLREEDGAVVLITMANRDVTDAIQRQVREIMGDSAKCFSWSELFLSKKLMAEFGGENDVSPRLVLLNTPGYHNLGDHAIAMAERTFLKTRHKNRVIEIPDDICRHCMNDISEHIAEKDILLLTGGGYMGSLWPRSNDIVHSVIERFPNNRIIVLPQSAHYASGEEGETALERAKTLCNSHRGLMLCARDRETYQDFGRYFPSCRRLLVPDMALSTRWPVVHMRSGIGICLRSDKEGILTDDEAKRIVGIACGLDGNARPLSQTAEWFPGQNNETAVLDKLREYSACRCVITDRLHGMVFSVITGTPCIVIDNVYGKNRALYETWLRGMPSVHFVDNPVAADWKALIAAKLESEPAEYDPSSMRPGYSPLADYISSLEGVVTSAR